MAIPIPKRPNVRNCTHIKVTGQRCGSPALRGEFFCYFHTRVIKGVQQRVDMQLHSMALLEDCESIQLSIMHVVDALVKGTLDLPRARLILQALRIAARNAKNVRFDDFHYRASEQPMVRDIPDYAQQYLIEHPEYGPPLSHCSTSESPCGAGAPAREAATKAGIQIEAQAAPQAESATQESVLAERAAEPAAKRRQPTATKPENNPAPQERKKPERDTQEEENELRRVQAAIPGAMAGNWRDLRTVFEFAGITERNHEALDTGG
jgi:hypothetical protein